MARLAIMFDNQPPELNAISGLDLAEQEAAVGVAKFDENEPRDDQGKWTSGGGSEIPTDASGRGLHNQSADTYAGLTASEWYTWAEASHDIQNAGTLKVGGTSDYGQPLTQKDIDEYKSIAARIQDAAANNAVAGVRLYRGETYDSYAALKEKYPHQKEVETPSLVSTTTDLDAAKMYLQEGGPVRALVEYGTKTGTQRGIQTSPLGVPSNEVILPQGARYRVASVIRDSEGTYRVSLYSTNPVKVSGKTINARAPVTKFDENEPRDDQGKWTAGAGGPALADLKSGKTYSGAALFHFGNPDYVFHGTSSANLEAIMKDGLGQKGAVYVASDPEIARQEANYAVYGDPYAKPGSAREAGAGGDAIVLAIRKDDPSVRDGKWKLDSEYIFDTEHPEDWGINAQAKVRIPPSAIKVLTPAEAWAEGKRVSYVTKYSENQPRDDHGRWTDGGGDTLTGGGELIGYSSTAYLDENGKLHTSNVDDAVRALGEGQKVVLDHPRQLSTLIQRLAEVAKAAQAAGEKAKDYDLCNVSVPGTNLFCADAKGFTRIEMPQLDGKPIAGSKADALPKNQFGEVETTSQFQQFLKDAGYSVDRETERADYLKATQSELSGVRTASLMGLMQEGKLADSTIFISKDNYIVDGHHRWAAKVGLEFGEGKVLYMNVARVNTDIITLMDQAKSFAHTWGIPQVAKRRPRGTYTLEADEAGLPYVKFNPVRGKRK